MGKYVSPAPTGEDVVQGLEAIREDAGCEARITLALGKMPQSLKCIVETYTEHGARIGVAREEVIWTKGGLPLVGVLLTALFKAYARSSQLAHADTIPHPSLRRK